MQRLLALTGILGEKTLKQMSSKNVISAHAVKLRKSTVFTPGKSKGHSRRVSGSEATRTVSDLFAVSDFQVLEGKSL